MMKQCSSKRDPDGPLYLWEGGHDSSSQGPATGHQLIMLLPTRRTMLERFHCSHTGAGGSAANRACMQVGTCRKSATKLTHSERQEGVRPKECWSWGAPEDACSAPIPEREGERMGLGCLVIAPMEICSFS